jgi:hypothetical protein
MISFVCSIRLFGPVQRMLRQGLAAFDMRLLEKVSVLLFTVTFHANLAHSLTRSPSHL